MPYLRVASRFWTHVLVELFIQRNQKDTQCDLSFSGGGGGARVPSAHRLQHVRGRVDVVSILFRRGQAKKAEGVIVSANQATRKGCSQPHNQRLSGSVLLALFFGSIPSVPCRLQRGEAEFCVSKSPLLEPPFHAALEISLSLWLGMVVRGVSPWFS